MAGGFNPINTFENIFERRNSRRLSIIILIFLAIALRLVFAFSIEHPGHGDMSYYMTLASNIADGRGFVIDYIWHFFYPADSLTHPANDFWMPLTSVIISFFLLILGKSMAAALLPSIICALLIAFITYELGLYFLNSKTLAFAAMAFSFFVPHMFSYSLQTDSTIYYAAFVSLGLYFIIKGHNDRKYLYFTAALAGLAHLTRQDGVLFFLTLLISIIFIRSSAKDKLKNLIICGTIYLAVLSPLLISNLHYFGSPFASGSYKTAFLRTYEDFYSHSKELSLSSYLASGAGEIIRFKLLMLFTNIKTTLKLFGNILFPIILLGIVNMLIRFTRPKERPFVFPPLLFMTALYLFYSLVAGYAAYHGAYYRSVQALTPFFIIFGIDSLARLIKLKAIRYWLLAILTIILFYFSINVGNLMVYNSTRLNLFMASLKSTIDLLHDSDDEIVIMTRAPWEVYYSTGYRAIQIPHDDLKTIEMVAHEFKANYLILPAPLEALEDIYTGKNQYPAFKYLANVPNTDMKLFGIE